MPLKAIVFDFDGTLADSFDMFIRTVESVLKMQQPFTAAEINNLRMHSAREAIQILKVKKLQVPGLLLRGMREIDKHSAEVMMFPGMATALQTFRNQGYELYIVSSHSQKGIANFLQRNQLTDAINHVYAHVGLWGKPKALKLLQSTYGLNSAECLYVGDEARDIEAAAKAGIKCISVTWGFNAPELLRARAPAAVVDTPAELVQAVQSFQ